MTRSPRLRAEAGTSIPEVAIAAALIFAILAMLGTGVRTVATGSQTSDHDLKRATMQRNALASLQCELEACSIKHNRFTIASDHKSIRFSRLVGADLAGNEVSGTWSSEIQIGFVPPGNLVRNQDGHTALLATGLTDLSITQPIGSSCFEIAVTAQGQTAPITRSARIFPKN